MQKVDRRLARGSLHRFHEKAFKLKMKFISFWVGCALGSGFHADSMWWSRFRSNLAQKGGTLPSGYRSLLCLHAMHRNRSGSFVLDCLPVRKGLIVTAVFPQA
jgi:hypothetical protein